jgi:hypothetical protein
MDIRERTIMDHERLQNTSLYFALQAIAFGDVQNRS